MLHKLNRPSLENYVQHAWPCSIRSPLGCQWLTALTSIIRPQDPEGAKARPTDSMPCSFFPRMVKNWKNLKKEEKKNSQRSCHSQWHLHPMGVILRVSKIQLPSIPFQYFRCFFFVFFFLGGGLVFLKKFGALFAIPLDVTEMHNQNYWSGKYLLNLRGRGGARKDSKPITDHSSFFPFLPSLFCFGWGVSKFLFQQMPLHLKGCNTPASVVAN